jgi:hypothetical protein
MAKPRKNKSGFHKDISSVLKGVPIPQGVRNWQPPDRPDMDRRDDSSSPAPSNISSVFKEVPAGTDSSRDSSAEAQSKSRNTEGSSIEKPDDRKTSQSTLIKTLDCPEDSSAKTLQSEKSEPPKRVVSYRDPLTETSVPSVEEQLRGKFPASKKALGKKGRRALVLSAPVLIIIIILIHRYCLRSAPQESEASAGSISTLVSKPSVSNDSNSIPEIENYIDWQVPELLPAQVMDFLKDPDRTEQRRQNKKPGERKGELDLRAILFSVQRPSAVVGGHIVYVGDRFNDVTITNITKDAVEFEKDGKTWVQSLR